MAHDDEAATAASSTVTTTPGAPEDAVTRLLDGFPALVGTWTSRGDCERLNRRWRDVTGVADHRGDGWLEAVHPDDREPVHAALRGAEAPPSFRLSGRDGFVEVTAFWEDLVGSDAAPMGRLCICVDDPSTNGGPGLAELVPSFAQMVSIALESVRAEGRIRRQATQLRGLTRAAVAINALRDVDDILDELTRVAAEIVGARAAVASLADADGRGRPASAVRGSDRYARWLDHEGRPTGEAIQALARREHRPIRLTHEELRAHPDLRSVGEAFDRPTPMRGLLAAPIVTPDGDDIGVVHLTDKVVGDFTVEDEAVLLQLAQLASVALDNARLREIEAEQGVARFRDEMMAGISHDMRSPVAAIVGLAEVLQDGDLTPEENATMLRGLSRQAHALDSLVRQFLDFSRIESGRELPLERGPVDVVDVIERVTDLYEHGREFIIGHPRRRPMADADEDRLEQVLVNLVDNAVTYSEGPVRVVAGRRHGKVIIDVVDDGPGIPEDELDRLFEKFQRGEEAASTPGTGLGLYVSRAIVDAHGGDLVVQSTLGIGSRFRVELAASDERRGG